jgi:hypothetical protein
LLEIEKESSRMSRWFQRPSVIALALAAVGLAAGAFADLRKPSWDDEAAFLVAANRLAAEGTLVSRTTTLNLASKPIREHALWHPPLYLYVLSIVHQDPLHPTRARLFSILCWVTCVVLAVVLIRGPPREMSSANRVSTGTIEPLAWIVGLAIASPVIVDGMSYIDIDTSVLAVAILVFVTVIARLRDSFDVRGIALIAAATAFMMWTKLTSPVFVVAAALLVSVLRREWKLSGVILAGGFFGAFLFGLSFWAFGRATHTDLSLMFTMYATKGQGRLLQWTHSPGVLLDSLYVNIRWSSLPLLVATILACLHRRRSSVSRAEDLCWATGIVLWLTYIFLFNTLHPKYIYPSALLFAVGAALYLTTHPAGTAPRAWKYVAPALAALAVGVAMGLPSAADSRPWPPLHGLSPRALVQTPELLFLVGAAVLLALSILAGILLRRRPETARVLITGFVIGGILAGGLSTAVLISDGSGMSPLNRPRQSGFETVLQIGTHLRPGLNVSRSRPTEFYTAGRLDEIQSGQDVYLRGWNADSVHAQGVRLLRQHAVDLVIDSRRFPETLLTETDCVDAGMKISHVGDYYVATFRPLDSLVQFRMPQQR